MGKKQKQEPVNNANDTRQETVTRELDCVLSQDDIAERNAILFRRMSDRKGEIAKAASMRMEAASLKSTAKELDTKAGGIEQEAEMILSEIEDAIRAVNDKIEKRAVECVRIMDYASGKVSITRNDTGEMVEEREMRNSERQLALGLELQARGQGCEGWQDKRGRVLFTSDGFTDSGEWATYYRSEQGVLKRVTAKALPPRSDREKAENDLAAFAMERGFQHVTGNGRVLEASGSTESDANSDKAA